MGIEARTVRDVRALKVARDIFLGFFFCFIGGVGLVGFGWIGLGWLGWM